MTLTKKEAILLLIYIFAVTMLFTYFAFQHYLYNAVSIIPGFTATYPSEFMFLQQYWISVVIVQFVILIGMKIKHLDAFFTPIMMELGNVFMLITWLPMFFEIGITYLAQGYLGELIMMNCIGGKSVEWYELFLMLSFASILFVFRKVRKNYWATLAIVGVIIGVCTIV